MPEPSQRRLFIKRLLAVSAAGALSLGGCGPQPTATPEPVAPAESAATRAEPPVPTATPAPTGAPSATSAHAAPTPAAPAVTQAAAAPATATPAEPPYLAVAQGPDPAEITRRALAALGGIERFVKKGNTVVIKPNICTDYHTAEYATTTNPDVVAALVKLCLAAGAQRVRVMDQPFGGTAQSAYKVSGIADAVKAAGGEMVVMNRLKFREIAIPKGVKLKKYKVHGDILDADVLINVPIAKDHAASVLTLGMKNLMGVVDDRNGMHARGLHQTIADLSSAVRPQLTIVDAVRILTRNGPTGGSLDDVKKLDTVIASTDIVAADAYATTLFNMAPKDIECIRIAAEMGLGQSDLGAMKIEKIAA